MAKRGLGRGLGALLGEESKQELNASPAEQKSTVHEVDILKLDRYLDQPRKTFDDEKLNELSESIKTHGIIQPIVVREKGGRFMIIAGERRFRAARKAGLKTVPIVIKDIDDDELLEIALIENIQREDLNAIEQAEAINQLMQEHEMTQEKVAERIGKSRSAVANSLRLLTLDKEVMQAVRTGELSAGHARTLVVLPKEKQRELCKKAIKEGLSVRAMESLVETQAA